MVEMELVLWRRALLCLRRVVSGSVLRQGYTTRRGNSPRHGWLWPRRVVDAANDNRSPPHTPLPGCRSCPGVSCIGLRFCFEARWLSCAAKTRNGTSSTTAVQVRAWRGVAWRGVAWRVQVRACVRPAACVRPRCAWLACAARAPAACVACVAHGDHVTGLRLRWGGALAPHFWGVRPSTAPTASTRLPRVCRQRCTRRWGSWSTSRCRADAVGRERRAWVIVTAAPPPKPTCGGQRSAASGRVSGPALGRT